MSNYTFYGIRYDAMRRNLGTDGTNGKLKNALTSADGIKKPNVSLTEDGFFDRYKVWNEETKSYEVKTNHWNMFNNWKKQIANYCTTVDNIITCRGTIRSVYSRYSTYISDLQFIKSRTNRFDSQAAAIFNLKSVADALNSFCADGLANFSVGIDEEGNEVIMYKWVDEKTGDIKYLKLYEMLNAGISLTGQTMTAEVAAEVLFDGKTPDEIKEIMINAVNNQIEMTNRGLDLGIFGVTEEADALEIYKEMFQDKYPELANVKSIDEVYKIMNIDPPKASDLGLPQEILSQLGENVEVFAGLVVTSLDVAGAYILDEDTGEKKYDVGMNVDFENVEYGKNVEGPYVISDDKDYADIKEKMNEGKTFEEAVKDVEQERIDNGEAPEDAAIKLTKDGKEEIIAPDGMTPEELGAGKEDPSVLGEEETDPIGNLTQEPTGGTGGSGGSGGGGGGSYGYLSGGSDDYVPTEPTSAVPGSETPLGGGGTTGRTPITDIIPDNAPSTDTLEASLNESTNTGFNFGSKDYDELALEEYSSAGDQVKAAGILAAVAEANELFDTNPTQLYSKLQQMGYNDNQINDIMSDRELTKQAFANNKQREDLAKIAEDKAKADGNNDYKSQYSNKDKSVDDIKKEHDLINSDPECANAKNELDAAVNEYKTAVEEANSALTEAKTLKAELDAFTNENGTDVDAMTDEQYNKYTELANKYNNAVDNANKKIENVNVTKENCMKAQEKYDTAKLKAREALDNQQEQQTQQTPQEPITPDNQKESVGVSDDDLLKSLTENNQQTQPASEGNGTSAIFTGNEESSQGGTIFGAASSATMNVEDSNPLGINVSVPTAQNVLESSTDLPTVTVPTSSEVIGGNTPVTEVSAPGNFVKDSTGISDNELLASVAIEDAENQKSKLNHIEQASGIGLVGLGAVALARNASDKKEISNMIKEHQEAQQVQQPAYTQTTNNEVNQSISNVLQTAGVRTSATNIPVQNSAPHGTPGADFDTGLKEEFAKSVIGSRVDLVTKTVTEASERFTFDKELFKEDLKRLNYSNEDVELLMSNEELAIIAVLDGKVRENLSQKASQKASQNGVLDYVSKYDTGRSVIELANGTVFDFLKEELAGVESGLDITTRSKLKRIFNDENVNKE